MSIFTQAPMRRVPSNSFDLSHDVKMTCHAGKIIPIYTEDCLPGDVVNMNSTVMARMMPMLAPIMHKMNITVFAHFIPYRLIWSGSEKFFENPIPDPNTPVMPYFQDVEIDIGSLGDYLGLPTYKAGSGPNTHYQYTRIDKINALAFAAYQKVYSDWFRDQNLINGGQETRYALTEGMNDFQAFNILRDRAWEHDYFTSCLPFAQKGDPVEFPIGDRANIYLDQTNTEAGVIDKAIGAGLPSTGDLSATGSSGTGRWMADSNGDLVRYNPNNTLYADLSAATATTVEALRWSVRLQEFLEKNARGGTRYIELMKAHFGVVSSDARLQRSEFIGSTTTPMVISEVLQQSATQDGTTPQGEMAGHGLAVGHSKKFYYRTEEHGIFMVTLNIRPKTAYSQGIPKMFSRFTPLDFPWPDFAQLGEQEVLNREVYYNDGDGANDEVFGFQSRYADKKYCNDRIAGEMRTSLDFWHMGRIFTSRPTLSGSFISSNPTSRIFAVTDTDYGHHYILHISHNIRIRRKLPKFGIPSL